MNWPQDEEPEADPALDAVKAALEPLAVAGRPDDDGQVRLSVAISLKRIADAIDGTTLGVDISESLCGIALQFVRNA